jgi:hypothetical protein
VIIFELDIFPLVSIRKPVSNSLSMKKAISMEIRCPYLKAREVPPTR